MFVLLALFVSLLQRLLEIIPLLLTEPLSLQPRIQIGLVEAVADFLITRHILQLPELLGDLAFALILIPAVLRFFLALVPVFLRIVLVGFRFLCFGLRRRVAGVPHHLGIVPARRSN